MTPGRDCIYDPRAMIWTNLYPLVLRMLYIKYQSSATHSSLEDFWMYFPIQVYVKSWPLGLKPFMTLGSMIWTNMNIHVLRMLHVKYQNSGTHGSQEEDFWSHFPIYICKFMFNFDPWAWPYLWPQGHDFNKLESPCPKDASCEISKLLNI